MRGLVIKSPWIELILSGEKTWEIRSSACNKREKISLIKSGSGLILGTVDLVDSIPLSLEKYKKSVNLHCIVGDKSELPYKNTHAWVLKNVVIYETPIPYKHPQGAVIWINLEQ